MTKIQKKKKNPTMPISDEDIERKKLSIIAIRYEKLYSHFGRQAFSYKPKHTLTL